MVFVQVSLERVANPICRMVSHACESQCKAVLYTYYCLDSNAFSNSIICIGRQRSRQEKGQRCTLESVNLYLMNSNCLHRCQSRPQLMLLYAIHKLQDHNFLMFKHVSVFAIRPTYAPDAIVCDIKTLTHKLQPPPFEEK